MNSESVREERGPACPARRRGVRACAKSAGACPCAAAW